ncbi:hypothetical protein WSK_2964 [Novosphingobium sp. Rr 2-17]|uniref:sulfite exporter TauE/SafE family protein n=1 Tax=Novosphingobium sp. Rr 2-17 TaxID=555793 RepID=UPI000269A53D|nr:sulfite exporter TauE/SafE family protein [Novosphingobium sp. Rr 2-17]EIZ78520.1 hypothetical protein WSK_2964 [Novosphingobium sp. Rr 2-17]
MIYLDDPWKWAACLLAVALIGMGKGGFAGLGTLAMPIVTLVLPPVIAAGILLPVLISQDIVSVWSFRREWDRWVVAWMLPGAIIGIGLGWFFAERVNEEILAAAVGLVSVIFAGQRLWAERGHVITAPSNSPGWVGLLFGIGTGLTSQVAHAGAPPFQMWVTPRKLPHTVYVGTNAVLFAAINWLKVPSYIALGALTPQVLLTSAVLIPVAIVCTVASLRLVRRMPGPGFYRAVYWMMLALGLYLMSRIL